MGRLLDYYSSDKNEREDLRAVRNTKPAIAVPAPNANVEVFFP